MPSFALGNDYFGLEIAMKASYGKLSGRSILP